MTTTPSIEVARLLEDSAYDLKLELLAGREGLAHRVVELAHSEAGAGAHRLHRAPPRRAGAGVRQHRDLATCDTLTEAQQQQVLLKLFESPLACVVVTKGLEVPTPLVDGCRGASWR